MQGLENFRKLAKESYDALLSRDSFQTRLVAKSTYVYGSQGCLLLILELQRWAIQALHSVRHRLLETAITNLVFYTSVIRIVYGRDVGTNGNIRA